MVLELRRMEGLMNIFIRKFTKVRSVADAARRAKSGIGQILRGSHGFKSYYVLDGGEGVGVAVMIFEDRESANATNDSERRKRRAIQLSHHRTAGIRPLPKHSLQGGRYILRPGCVGCWTFATPLPSQAGHFISAPFRLRLFIKSAS
jgi:hypothetical protein